MGLGSGGTSRCGDGYQNGLAALSRSLVCARGRLAGLIFVEPWPHLLLLLFLWCPPPIPFDCVGFPMTRTISNFLIYCDVVFLTEDRMSAHT